MSVDEYMSRIEYSEYNYSDAIIDGRINEDNQMNDEEQENYEISDDEKSKMMNDANEGIKVIEEEHSMVVKIYHCEYLETDTR